MMDGDSESKDLAPGRGVLDRLAYESGPEFLDRDLEGLRQRFEEDRTTTLSAFEALEAVMADAWLRGGRGTGNFGGLDPRSKVELPLWAVFALATGWASYREGNANPGGPTLGEAFGLEGKGQGRQKTISKEQTEARRRGLALEIAELVLAGASVEHAVGEVAVRHGVSEDTGRQAWKRYGKATKKRLTR